STLEARPVRGVGQGTFLCPLPGVHRASLVRRPLFFQGAAPEEKSHYMLAVCLSLQPVVAFLGRMLMKPTHSVLMLAALLFMSEFIHAAQYKLTDLDSLLPNKTLSEGWAINNSGTIVTDFLLSDGFHAFVYSNGSMTDLGAGTFAYGINSAGTVVGYSPVS